MPSRRLHVVATIALLAATTALLSACGTLPLEHMMAERDFAGCVRHEMSYVNDPQWSDSNYGDNWDHIAKCEEALGKRAEAIDSYRRAAGYFDSAGFPDSAIARRQRADAIAGGAPLLTPDALSAEAQTTMAYVAAHRNDPSPSSDDDDDTSSQDATSAALMSMAMGMMSQPSFVPHGRTPVHSVPTPAFVPSASSLPVSQTPTPKPASTYRDATSCVSLGQPYNGNMILPVTNHCNGPITVHFGTGMGGEFLNLRSGQERGYTTFERRVAYACFRKSDQDDYCFKSSTD